MADQKKQAEVEKKRSILERLVDTFGLSQAATNVSPDKKGSGQETERQKTLKKLMDDF